MFWKRNHAQEQPQVAHPSFRPQLECLEDRNLLDASGVADSIGALSSHLGQLASDAVHLQIPAAQKDAANISQDVNNITTRLRNDPVGNLLLDYGAVLSAEVTMARGIALVTFGLSLSAGTEGVGAAVGVPMVAIGAHVAVEGADMYMDAVGQFYVDLVRVFKGGQQQSGPTPTPKPNAPSVVGTWSGSAVPDDTSGFVSPRATQKVTLTLNADGSGNLSIVPFAGSGLAVSFPVGTVNIDSSSDTASFEGNLHGIVVDFNMGMNGSLSLQGGLDAHNNTGYVDFVSLNLNKQG